MAGGDDTRYHPRRRIVRGHSHRDPFEAQGEPTNPSKGYGPVVSNSEEDDKLDVAYLYNQYFINAKGDY